MIIDSGVVNDILYWIFFQGTEVCRLRGGGPSGGGLSLIVKTPVPSPPPPAGGTGSSMSLSVPSPSPISTPSSQVTSPTTVNHHHVHNPTRTSSPVKIVSSVSPFLLVLPAQCVQSKTVFKITQNT